MKAGWDGALALYARLWAAVLVSAGVWFLGRQATHDMGPGWNLLLGICVATVGTLVATFLARGWALERSRPLRQSARKIFTTLGRKGEEDAHDSVTDEGLPYALNEVGAATSHSLSRVRADRDRLRQAIHSMQDGVMVINKEGRVERINDSLRAFCGVEGPVAGLLPIEVVRHEGLQNLLRQVRVADEEREAEYEMGGLDLRVLHVRAAPFGSNGYSGVVAVLRDVSEVRRLESMRRDFVANVSHELRTPIAAIGAAVETLQIGALDVREDAEAFTDIIARQAERLHLLVEDLLELSRIDANRLQLEAADVSVPGVVKGVLQLHQGPAEKRSITLGAPEDLPDASVRADYPAFERILSNLVENAIKYCGEGDDVQIFVSANDTHASVEVRDSGPGIEARHLPRLFERFYRADRGRSRDIGGTGLGLAIVKNLAEAMGGDVRVESTLGQGSSFFVSLPLADQPN